jgi:hypothetical protein
MRVTIEVTIESEPHETERDRLMRWMVTQEVEEALQEISAISGMRVSFPGTWAIYGGRRSISRELVSAEG